MKNRKIVAVDPYSIVFRINASSSFIGKCLSFLVAKFLTLLAIYVI